MKPQEREPPPRFPVTLWIMTGLLLWGGYLAVGAVWAGGNHAAWRGFIVFGCTLALLGLWWLALASRRRRVSAKDES